MAIVQVKLFQVDANVTFGTVQADVDAARSTLESQVNTFLSTLASRNVLDVQFKEAGITTNAQHIVFTAEVTYKQ